MHRNVQTVFRVALVMAVAVVSGCSTLAYRSVQGDFVDAVAADNAWSVSPFGGNAAEGIYADIDAKLTDEYIGNLDARLQANAWLLRAVSEWRLGEFEAALSSAKSGRGRVTAEQKGSRDEVMLTMLDGLVIDSDLLAKYRKVDGELTLDTYNTTFASDFATALKMLDDGMGKAGPATPPEIGWYYHYHRWRLLQNWRTVVNRVNDAGRSTARTHSEGKVGEKLKDAAAKELESIPENHPLHQLILVQQVR